MGEKAMSNFNKYMEMANTEEPQEFCEGLMGDLQKAFIKKGYEVDYEDKNAFGVTNKHNINILLREQPKGKIVGFVQGYKGDIQMHDLPTDFKELEKTVRSLDMKWMKEYDPDGDRW
jgi:hypothetical protein